MKQVYCPDCGALIRGKSTFDLKNKLNAHYKRKHPRIYQRKLIKSTERAKKVGTGVGIGLDVLAGFFG